MTSLDIKECILAGYALISTLFNIWVTSKYIQARNKLNGKK